MMLIPTYQTAGAISVLSVDTSFLYRIHGLRWVCRLLTHTMTIIPTHLMLNYLNMALPSCLKDYNDQHNANHSSSHAHVKDRVLVTVLLRKGIAFGGEIKTRAITEHWRDDRLQKRPTGVTGSSILRAFRGGKRWSSKRRWPV